MQLRRSTQHLLAATAAASALVLSACGDADEPGRESVATDGVAADPTDRATAIPADFPLDAYLDEPPVDDGEQTVDGPGPRADGARALTACGRPLPFPAGGQAADDQLSYAVASVEGYDGRTLRLYPTAAEASEVVEQVRAGLDGCERDGGGDGLSDRLFATYDEAVTGADSITFGWTYEETEGVGSPAGQLLTVARVGRAVLTVEWSGEGGADTWRALAPRQVDLVGLVTGPMCVFADAGC